VLLPVNPGRLKARGCLRRAALKTHALQTLARVRRAPEVAKRLECARFMGAFDVACIRKLGRDCGSRCGNRVLDFIIPPARRTFWER